MDRGSHQDALAAIAAIAAGTEDALIVVGEVGAGKNSLLRSALAASKIRTVIVRSQPGESAFPLSGVAAVLDAITGEHSSYLARQFRLRSNVPQGQFAAANDLLDLVTGLNLSPTMILINRLDLMDQASQSLIGVIAAHLTGTGLRIVGTAAGTDPPEPLAGLRCIRLAPWSVEELIEAARDHFPDSDEPTVRIMASYAGGNPGILLEQLSKLHVDQLNGSAWLTLPPRVADSPEHVTVWPDMLPDPESRQLLELLSLAPQCHIDVVTQLRPGSIHHVEDLVDANLLKLRGSHVSFVDQRLRSHAYWSQQARARHDLHRELAEAADAHDPGFACWHHSFVEMDEPHNRRMLEAAVWLVEEQRIPEAIEFVERALRRTSEIEDCAALLVELCTKLMRDGELSLVLRYSAVASSPNIEPALVLELAVMKLTAQLIDQGVMRDEEAKALSALHVTDNVDRATDLLMLSALYRTERWEVEEASELIEQARAMTENASAQTIDKVSAMMDIIDTLKGEPLGGAEKTNLDHLDNLPPDLLLMRGRELTFREQYVDARHAFRLVLNHPRNRARIWSDLAMYASISNEMNAGQFGLARRDIETWSSASQWINRRTAANGMISAWHSYAVGEDVRAKEAVDTVLELASRDSSLGLRARAYALRGSIGLLSGDPDGAVLDLRHVGVVARQLGNPTLPRHWADYVEACALTDRVKELNATVAALERRTTLHPSRWGALVLARCRAISASGPKSLSLFADAVQMFDRSEQPYEYGRTLLALADRQALLGMDGEARHSRVAAITAFESAGADAWARRISRPSRETAAPTKELTVLEQLTGDERHVVHSVLQGMRNREIAKALHVSVRTVELRLTHIYRALGVRSRGELTALLNVNGPQADESAP